MASRTLWSSFAVTRQVTSFSRLLSNLSDRTREVRLDYLEGTRDGITVLAMNRPSRKNALGRLFVSQV
jgi:hypothetical protein